MIKQLASLLGLVCMLTLPSSLVQAAQKTSGSPQVLVLPFQVNAAPEMSGLTKDLPQLVASRMRSRGLRVLPQERVQVLLQKRDVATLDLREARALGQSAHVRYVVYGLLNQLGDGFSMDARIVPVADGAKAQSLNLQKDSMASLTEAADMLADEVANKMRPALPESRATPLPGNGLSDIKVRGIRVLDPDVVLMRLSIRKGDKPDEKAINDEVKRIWEMGYFSDVQASLEGNTLVFTVVEKPRIDHILVEGADEVDQEDVLATMNTKNGSILNERLLAEDIQKVKELYHKEGYYLADVNYRIDQRPNNRGSVLVVTVKEGKKLYIKAVNVNGLKQIERGALDEYMALQPRGLFSWFTGKGVLKEEYLERDSNAIAAYGLNHGYMDIQVSTPKVNYQSDGIVIDIDVNEGPRYKIGSIKFAGDLINDEKTLLDVVELDEQKTKMGFFALGVMQEDVKRLTQHYADQGYAFAEVDTKIMKDEGSAEPSLTVGYVITKKQKVYIRRAMVEGNQKTRDNVIFRELRLADGDPYDGAKLRRTTERLNRLRYFEAVDTELVPTGSPEEVDLKIKVKEGNTGALMGGIGYSTYYDVGVTASIMERNLWGRGYWLQLQGYFSWRRTAGTLSFTNPRVYDTDLLFGNDLYYTYDYWDDFTKETIGDSIRFAYPIGEYTSVGWGYRLERYHLYDIDKDHIANSIRKYVGYNWTSAVNARITRDTTDSRERPSKGTISRLWAEYGGGGLGGNDNFIKAVADWQGFYSWRPNHTFHLRGRLGGVFQNTDEIVPVFERFWVGGIDTIRGYSYTDLAPRDKHYRADQIGGDRMGVLNVEYVWTFQKDMGLALVPFFDAGFNIDSDQSMDLNEYTVASAGLELRWRSPMGDLRIAYGIPLVRDYDHEMPKGRLEFTMGQFF